MSLHTKDLGEGSLADAVADLVEVGSRTGLCLLFSIFRAVPAALGAASPVIAQRRGRSNCNCRIPTPCWEPRALGTFATVACPGSVSTLRIRVTNCGSSPPDGKLGPRPASKGAHLQPTPFGAR